MTKSLSYGPNGTPVEGVTAVTFAVAPLNYTADFAEVESGPGKIVYTDTTSPQDQPSTLRIAQQSRPNVYAGTSVDPSCYLPNRKGTDTIIEIREFWNLTDSTDSTFLNVAPVRCAITMTLPDSSVVTADAVSRLIARGVAALFAQGDATIANGVDALLHGAVKKG